MLLSNVYRKVNVLKVAIFVTMSAFTFSFAHGADERQENKRVDRLVTALKRNHRCESVILSSGNLSTVFWLKKGEIESSQPLWSEGSRKKLSKMVKNLKLNHKVVDVSLPTQAQFESDPYKTAQIVSRMTTDAINEFKWKGNLDCKAKAFHPKAQILMDMIKGFIPTAEAQGELSGGRRSLTPPAALKAIDETTTAQNLAVALKKKNENGACKSFLIESKNLTAVMWIENAQLVSGGYLWGKDARAKFKKAIKGVNVVKRELKRTLPNAARYAKDPILSSQRFEQEFDDAFRIAKEKQQFRCGVAAIN